MLYGTRLRIGNHALLAAQCDEFGQRNVKRNGQKAGVPSIDNRPG